MKSFTDISQSKKLAEILPLESADMWWAERYEGHTTMDYQYVVEETPYYYLSLKKPSIDNYSQDTVKDIPCWSLAALLSVLQEVDDNIEFWSDHEDWHLDAATYDVYSSSLVDTCVEMILKLHELKML